MGQDTTVSILTKEKFYKIRQVFRDSATTTPVYHHTSGGLRVLENETQCSDPHVVETFGDIDTTLQERGSRYGDFCTHSHITQHLKDVMVRSPKWGILSADKKEALDMIAHKIGRILNGDPEYHDSWHDIAGYAKLVADTLCED